MKRSLTTGLTLLIPLAVTIAIAVRILNLLTRPFIQQLKSFFYALNLPLSLGAGSLYVASQIIILALLCLIILGVGALAQTKALKHEIHRLELALRRIPLIRLVFDPVHKALVKLLNPKTPVFTGPRALEISGIDALCYGVGVDGTPLSVIEEKLGEPIEVFLMLGVPNPLMGFLLLSTKKNLKNSPMNLEETLKYMVSCGLVHPREVKLHA